MTFNINERVSVTLTERGADWLNEYHWKKIDHYKRLLEQFSNTKDWYEELFPTNNKAGDTVEYSLWEIMEKFGDYFAQSIEAPFVNNTINFLIPEC